MLTVCLFPSCSIGQGASSGTGVVQQGGTAPLGVTREPPEKTPEGDPASGPAPETAGDETADNPFSGSAPEDTDSPERYRLAGCLDGALVLAELGGPQVYTAEQEGRVHLLLPDGTAAASQTDWASLAGSLVEADETEKEADGSVTGSITGGTLRLLAEGFDDRCVLYLSALEALWERDPVLNGGLNSLGVDLSGTSLSPSEQTATAYLFASAHGLWDCTILGTWQDLADQGYITGVPVEGASGDALLWQWVDGCVFIIREKEWNYNLLPSAPPDGGAWRDNVYFDAVKWRTSLRAAFLSDRVSWQDRSGRWGEILMGTA